MLECYFFRVNSIILRCCVNQKRVGSKGVSPSIVIMVKPMGSGQFAVIRTVFFMGRLSGYIYEKFKVGAKSVKRCDRKKPTKEYMIFMKLIIFLFWNMYTFSSY